MFVKVVSLLSAIALVSACTSAAPRIAVDPSSITNQAEYNQDFEGCLNLAKTIDLSSEKAAKAVAGGLLELQLSQVSQQLSPVQFLHLQFPL